MLYDLNAYRKTKQKKIRMTKREKEIKDLKEELIKNTVTILALLHKNLDALDEIGYTVLDEDEIEQYNVDDLEDGERIEIAGFVNVSDDVNITKKQLINNIKNSRYILGAINVIDEELDKDAKTSKQSRKELKNVLVKNCHR